MNKVVSKKIKRLRDLVRIVEKLKKEGKKIVHCHGVFDLVHPGHIRHFNSAKSYGDILIVTLTADKFVRKGPGRPIFNQYLRAEVLASVEYIDYIAIVDSDSAIPAIKKLKPDFYIKGPDYKSRKEIINMPRKLNSEEEAVKGVGGKLIFTDDTITFSSSKLINDYLAVYPPKTKKYLEILKAKYTPEYIFDKLAHLRNLKILVIGDAIIDQYHYCQPMGKSSKEPIMVHQYLSEETFLGGTLATASHIASLSSQITLVTVLGKKNSFRNFILKHLKGGVKPILFYQANKNTIIKRRYLYEFTQQKLFQISYLDDDFISEETERRIIKFIKREIKKYDLVIVNDFGHGLMTDKIIKLVSARANYLALNVQANSANWGFNVITKYPKADFICIDEQEIRLATHDKYSDVHLLIKKIFNKMRCSYMMVTRGPEGSIVYSKADGFHDSPALTEKIVDRVGAGDALFAITSPLVYAGIGHEIVPFIGNVAGALQVGVVGNRSPIEFSDMVKFVTRLLK